MRLSCRILKIKFEKKILLVPMIVSKIDDDRNQHGEGLIFIGLENVEEVVVLKETHGSVSYLQVNTANASYDSLEQFRNEVFDFIDFANFQDFLEFCQEKGLLDAVSEGPVLEETLEERDG
jgi:hypothetical protein